MSQKIDFPKGIGAPATRALADAGFTQLKDVAGVSASKLKQLHGMGPKALTLLQAALEQKGMPLS